MEELINAMSDSDLAELKAKYPDNTAVTTLIDGILATREREAVQAKAMEKFTKGIAKTFSTLPHPDNIHNIYARWGEVDIPSGEPEEVEVVVTPAEVNGDGNITTPAVMGMEMRMPTVKGMAWVVEVNHATRQQGTRGGNDTSPKTSKRAITVFKRNGTQLEPRGNFASGQAACDFLKIPVGTDDAKRVLIREGYIHEPYEGTDFRS